jgi:hypothetical protein
VAKLGGTGIHTFVDRAHAEGMAPLAHRRFAAGIHQCADAAIGEALALEAAQGIGIKISQILRAHPSFDGDDFLDLHQEPGIDLRQIEYLVKAVALAEGLRHVPDALRPGAAQFAVEFLGVGIDLVEAVDADLQAAQRLLHRFLETAADGHDLADRLHLRCQAVIGHGEFLEGEARHLGHHVVDRGLEGGRRGAAGDVVLQLVQRIADGELGRHLGDRETRGLGGQRRGARHARIHLDHDHAAVVGVDRELHIRTTGIDADLAQHRDAGVAHDLVFLVGQRLRRRHGDRVAGMHAHRIQVFDRADDDAVVLAVAHHLHLELFPAEQRLLDQQLLGRRGFEATLADFDELFLVVGDAAARATHGE